MAFGRRRSSVHVESSFEPRDKPSQALTELAGAHMLRYSNWLRSGKAGKKVSKKPILIKDEMRSLRSRQRTKRVHFRLPKPKSGKVVHPLEHDSPWVQRWHYTMVVPLSYEIWAFPFRLAFGVAKFNGIMQTDLIVDVAFFCDALVQCSTKIPPATLLDQDAAITTFRGISRIYLRRRFLWDFLPPALYYAFTALQYSLGLEENLKLWLWWLSSTPRMAVRTGRLLHNFRDMSMNLKINVRLLETFKFMMVILLSSHCFGCVMFWLSRLLEHDASTWVADFHTVLPTFDHEHEGLARLYLICLYKGFNLISGLAYDYGMPKNPLEIVWRMATMVFQVYMSSLILGSLLNYIVRNSPEEVAYKRRVDDMVAYVEANKIPPELAAGIYGHIEFQHKRTSKKTLQDRDALPRSLLVKATQYQYRAVMDKSACKGTPLFGCSQHFLDDLVISLQVLHLHPGEQIAKKGDIAWQLYLVADGAVSLMDDENRIVRVIRSDVPDMAPIAGAVPFFIGMFHMYSIRARFDGEVQLLVLGREESERLFAAYPAELQRIRDNILASYGLAGDGQDLSGGGGEEGEFGERMEVKQMIQGAIQDQTYRRYAAFFSAVENGNAETVEHFLRSGTEASSSNCDGRTALHLASLRGHHKVMELLLEHGADINAKDMWGHTPYWAAVCTKQDLAVSLLKQRTAHLDVPHPEEALWDAACAGDLETVRMLIDHRVDPDIRTCDQRAALHVCAAEGHEHVVDYLLRCKADINVRDRFDGTPLKDAVLGGHNLLASILRSKGAVLPDGMGADLLCTASSEGNIPLLQLLFECQVDLNLGDYDRRCALHLAAAEARVLAVSFLLSHTADPNVQDRWGGQPLDDALTGGTLYHMYCAKLIRSWGGTVGTFDTTSDVGRERMQQLDAMNIKDAFNLVKKLLNLGFSQHKVARASDEDIATSSEATLAVIPVVSEMRFGAERLCATIRHRKSVLSKTLDILNDVMEKMPKLSNLKQQGNGSPGSKSALIQSSTFRALGSVPSLSKSPSTFSMSRQSSISIEEDAEDEDEPVVEEEEVDAALFDPLDALEADEEEALHKEVDKMQQLLVRCQDSGLTAQGLASLAFQRSSAQILMISEALQSLIQAFVDVRMETLRQRRPPSKDDKGDSASDAGSQLTPPGSFRRTASADGWGEDIGAVSEANLEQVLGWLSAGNLQEEVEDIVGEAHAFLAQEHASTPSHMQPGPAHAHSAPSAELERSKAPARHGGGESEEADGDCVPIEAVIAGSRTFRRLCLSLQIDAHLCRILQSQLLGVLSEEQCRQLVAVDTIEVKAGAFQLSEDGHEPEVWYILVDGVMSVADVDHRLRNHDMLGAQGGRGASERIVQAGTPLGAWQALTGTEAHTAMAALDKCTLLQLQVDPLLQLVRAQPELQATLAQMMAEAPLSSCDPASIGKGLRLLALPDKTPADDDAAPQSPKTTALGAHFANLLQQKRGGGSLAHKGGGSKAGEMARRNIRDALQQLGDLWDCLSMGNDVVPIGFLLDLSSRLGEAGKETFRKLFAAELDRDNLHQPITQADYWQCWLRFAAEDDQEDGEASDDELDEKEGAEDRLDHDAMSNADDDKEGLLDTLHAKLSSARSLKPRFFEPAVIDTYEVSFEQVAGDLSKSLPRKKVVEFLNQVFVDFPYQIAAHNVREFFQEFSAQGVHATSISWTEIRTVLREHRMGIVFNESQLLVGSALNPRSPLLAAWRSLVRLCAVYYVAMVPVRAAFLPWDSMTHPLALATDLPADLLVSVHLLVCANTAYRSTRSKWVSSRIKIIRKLSPYVAMAALPLDWFAYNSGATNEMCCFWRLPKMLLVLSFPRNVNSSQSSVRRKLTSMIYIVLFVLHLSSCIWFFLGRVQLRLSQPSISWYQVSPSLADETFDRADLYGWHVDCSTWDQYLVALYWVTSTFTLNGAVGDVVPQNVSEALFAIILMVLSMTLYQWTIGEVSGIIMNADMHLVRRREEYSSLSNYIQGNKLPAEIGNEILSNFDAAQSSSTAMQRECFKHISHRFQVDVSRFLYKETLENVMLFEGCSDSFVDSICNITRVTAFVPEQTLFHEGDAATELFIVVSGAVDVVAKSERGDVNDGEVKEGNTAGELACVFGIPHTHSARAAKLQGASCLCMRREQFLGILQLFPDDEHTIADNALLQFERSSVVMKTTKGSSRMSASTGLTGNSKLSLDEPEDQVERQSESSDGESGVNSSLVGADLGKKMQLTLQQLKARHSAALLHMLHKAAMEGELDRMEQLLSRMPDKAVNDASESHRTALHVAAVHGRVDAVKFLIEHKADPHSKDTHSNTPFNDAVLHGKDEVAAMMRQLVPGIRLELPASRVATLLSQAAAEGKMAEVKRLLDNKAEVNAANADSRTALHVAACSGHAEVVGALLDANANAYAKDKVGWTALEGAVMADIRAVQDLMNSKGVTLGTGRNMEMTVRLCGLAADNDVDRIKMLVRNGADVGVGDYDMRTPLHLAAACGKLAVLDYLLGLKVNINPLDRFGGTPLDDAHRHGNKTAASALEERGALGKGDEQQAAMLEGQMRTLQEQMKEARAPVVAASVEGSVEVAMGRYLQEDLSPLLESLGEKLQETLRRVIRSLKSVSEAMARQDRRRKQATLVSSAALLLKIPVATTHALPALINNTGDKILAESNGGSAWHMPVTNANGCSPSESRPGTEEVYFRKDAWARKVKGMTGNAHANGDQATAHRGGYSEQGRPESAEALLDKSLETGWTAGGADPAVVEKLGSPLGSDAGVPHARPFAEKITSDPDAVMSHQVAVPAEPAPSLVQEQWGAARGDGEQSPDMQGGRNDPASGSSESGSGSLGSRGQPYRAADDHGTSGPAGEGDHREELVSTLGEGETTLVLRGQLGEERPGDELRLNANVIGALTEGLSFKDKARAILPGAVDDDDDGDATDEEESLDASPEPEHGQRSGSPTLFLAVESAMQREQRQGEESSPDRGEATAEEEEAYRPELQGRWRLLMKREIELYDLDVEVDEVAGDDIEEWFEFVLVDLTAMNKAIAALRLEIDAASHGSPLASMTSKAGAGSSRVWKMVMGQATVEMQALRQELGVCMVTYKALRQEVNSMMKGRARQRARSVSQSVSRASKMQHAIRGRKGSTASISSVASMS